VSQTGTQAGPFPPHPLLAPPLLTPYSPPIPRYYRNQPEHGANAVERNGLKTNHVLGQEQSAYRSSPHLHRRRRLVGPRSNRGADGVDWVSGSRIQFNRRLPGMASHCQRRLPSRRCNDAVDQWFRTSSAADRQSVSYSNYFYHRLRR
jgi:hypothetical protein